MRRRAILGRLSLLGLSLVLALLVVELGLRVFRPQKHFVVTVNTWDPVLGTRHVPGRKGFLKNPEYEIGFRINSKGLRDREIDYEKPSDTGRILCLGDSFTFGYGVETSETFAKVLETLLAQHRTDPRRWEVLNAGVGSTGTAHQYSFYAYEGRRYAPDIVVLCFFPGNDFADNHLSQMFHLENGELVQRRAPRTGARKIQSITRWLPGYDSFFAHSHLMSWLKIHVAKWHREQIAATYSSRPGIAESSWSAQLAARDTLTLELVSALHESCKRDGAELVVALIPPPDAESLPQRVERFSEAMSARSIGHLTLGPDLEAAERRGVTTIYRRDRHWTRAGHRIVAQTIFDYLLSRGFVDAEQAPASVEADLDG